MIDNSRFKEFFFGLRKFAMFFSLQLSPYLIIISFILTSIQYSDTKQDNLYTEKHSKQDTECRL